MSYSRVKQLVHRRSRVRLSLALTASFILTISFGVACQTLTPDPFVSGGQRIYKAQCIACHGPLGQGDGYVVFTPPVADLTSEHIQKKLDARCSEAFMRAVQTPRWDHGGLSFLMEILWP